MKNNALIKILLFSLTTFALTLGFYNNFWGTVKQDRFETYDIYCQSQVIGRVIKAEKDGVFSKGGFTGWVRDNKIMKDMTWEEMTYFQFEIYKNQMEINTKNFIVYDGQIGGQGMIYSFLDKISPFSNSQNLKLFWLLTSLTIALIFSVFIFWVYKNYGLLAGVITSFLILISPWIIVYGRNLYWILSSFYFPFIILLMLFYRESEYKLTIPLHKLFLFSVILVLTKLFFSGFELITTFLVMFSVPLFYYMILNKWDLILSLKRFVSIVFGSVVGIIIYILTFSYQLSSIKGNYLLGIKHILYSFSKRTSGNSSDFPEVFKASLEANVMDVIKPYLNSTVIELGFIKIRFFEFFIILCVFSALIFLTQKLSSATYKNRKKNIALFLTTWISILAPLSWFVIFKAHSYIHLGYNDIAWYMPFCLFGFVLIGSVTSSVIRDISEYFKDKRKVRLDSNDL